MRRESESVQRKKTWREGYGSWSWLEISVMWRLSPHKRVEEEALWLEWPRHGKQRHHRAGRHQVPPAQTGRPALEQLPRPFAGQASAPGLTSPTAWWSGNGSSLVGTLPWRKTWGKKTCFQHKNETWKIMALRLVNAVCTAFCFCTCLIPTEWMTLDWGKQGSVKQLCWARDWLHRGWTALMGSGGAAQEIYIVKQESKEEIEVKNYIKKILKISIQLMR